MAASTAAVPNAPLAALRPLGPVRHECPDRTSLRRTTGDTTSSLRALAIGRTLGPAHRRATVLHAEAASTATPHQFGDSTHCLRRPQCVTRSATTFPARSAFASQIPKGEGGGGEGAPPPLKPVRRSRARSTPDHGDHSSANGRYVLGLTGGLHAARRFDAIPTGPRAFSNTTTTIATARHRLLHPPLASVGRRGRSHGKRR